MCGFCGEGWRFETTVLGGDNAGQVKAVLHPISAEWENSYSQPSEGSIVLAVGDPALEDIYAGSSGIYISQVMKDGSRRARFGGYIVKDNGVGGGAGRVAMKSIDAFLDKRLACGPEDPYTIGVTPISGTGGPIPPAAFGFLVYKPLTETTSTKIYDEITDGGTSALAAILVNRIAKGNLEGGPVLGLPNLNATFQAPFTAIELGVGEDTICNWWDFKNIGQMIRELVEAENGIKYRLDHTFNQNTGYWSSLMTFSDTVGTARDYTILSDREAREYGLEIDAENKANRVYGVGQGSEGYTQYSIAYDADLVDNLPEFQHTEAWKDVPTQAMLDSLTRGWVTDHRDPTTVPSATIYGLPIYDPDDPAYYPQRGFPGPEILEPGDTFNVDIGYGFITVEDLAVKCLAVAWSLDQDDTAKRTIAMQPIIRPNTSVRTQTPRRPVAPTQPVVNVTPPAKSIPWPVPGLVSRSQSSDLAEISGMQYSETTPGYVWVVEDEKEAPDQVSLIRLATGARAGYFNITGVSPAPHGDPEAIRLARSSNKLVIADIGDNDNDRPTSGANQPSLLVVTEPKGGGNKGTLPTTRLPISYPGGLQINAETLLIHPLNEEVFIVTKEPGQARVYSFGTLASMNTTDNEGTLVATLGISMVSDGTHTWRGDYALFRTARVSDTQVYDVAPWGKVGSLPTPPMAKSEAITVESACAFLTTTEGLNAPIYRVLIPTKFGATCNTQSGPVGTGTGGQTGPNGPQVVPGQVLNLQQWKLQLPI